MFRVAGTDNELPNVEIAAGLLADASTARRLVSVRHETRRRTRRGVRVGVSTSIVIRIDRIGEVLDRIRRSRTHDARLCGRAPAGRSALFEHAEVPCASACCLVRNDSSRGAGTV